MACLVAAYKAMNGAGMKPRTELTLMIRPLPCSRMCGSTARRRADRTEEIGLEQGARLLDRALLGSAGDTDAGIVDKDVDAPGSVEHLAHRAGHRVIVGDVERQEHHSAALLPGEPPCGSSRTR